MSAATRFKIEAIVTGVKGVEKLKSTIKQLSNTAKPTAADIATLRAAANRLGRQSDRTENELKQQVSALTELRANVALTSKSYKVLTADIQRAEKALEKATATSKRSKIGGVSGAVKGLGAIAGSAVFGGPEGAIGASIGLLKGGPTAALAGGAIGAQVGMVRKSISEVAEYNASLERQRKALKLVIGDTNRYSKSQDFLAKKSKSLAIPQDVIVRQFTALTASVKGAGGSVTDAEDAFKAIAAGIRGTGGNLEDMKAAMTATSQVFSKGKVSAEELRQQLGERLPGAFTIFAESMGKTPAELDKALEGGKVTLQDFMTFSDMLFKKYGENAEILAQGPEAAGDRLATSMSEFKDALGDILGPIGASFQTVFTAIVEDITAAIKAFNRFMGIGLDNAIAKAEREIATAKARLAKLQGDDPRTRAARTRVLQTLTQAQNNLNVLKQKEQKINGETEQSLRNLKATGTSTYDVLIKGVDAYKNSIMDINKQIEDATKNAFTKMEDALVNFVMNGKLSFKDFARSIIADITRIYIRSQILSMFKGMGNLGSLFGGGTSTVRGSFQGSGLNALDFDDPMASSFAKGGVIGRNGIVPFGKGAVFHSPHIFPFKDGIGLLGESGSESIMPLKRGRDGKLGVIAHGGGGTSVVVNVDASGSDVQGDEGNAAALGRAISSAVTEEIAKQKRPGGLLSAA